VPPAGASALVAALEADPKLRVRVAALLGVPAGLPEALHRLVDELRAEREATARRFEASDGRAAELRADMNARFEAMDRRFEELRADMNARFEAMDRRFEHVFKRFDKSDDRIDAAFRRVDALGARWGLHSEASFRDGLRRVIGRRFGVEVQRWEHQDAEGVVFGHPARVELDIVVRDGETVLVEIKSHAGRAAVAEFRRTADLYDKIHGTRSRRLLVAPAVDQRALELAAKLDIEISTDLSG
jgi:hypothetical protein